MSRTGTCTAALVAAPACQEITSFALNYLRIAPRRPQRRKHAAELHDAVETQVSDVIHRRFVVQIVEQKLARRWTVAN
jgi:hypothetical protein